MLITAFLFKPSPKQLAMDLQKFSSFILLSLTDCSGFWNVVSYCNDLTGMLVPLKLPCQAN